MKKGRYNLEWIYRDVAHILYAQGKKDLSATTILTHINNTLDYWGKDGFQVNHDYNQDRAIKKVREIVEWI